jgi:poly(A) polymerase
MEKAKIIINTLKKNGYIAYFAGGYVRDYLLNHKSDDIDIATDAKPEIIEKLFSHTIPIGKAFGIILVIIDGSQYEVATFREDFDYVGGRKPKKVSFTNEQTDAQRRDFTINGMFYDPIEDKVIDYVKGKEDLEKKVIRAIGDANKRFKEDKLRMIRAVRLSSRFGFEIEENTKKAILKYSKKLFPSVSIERVVQEFTKMQKYKGFKDSLLMLFEYGLLQTIFPVLEGVSFNEIEKRLKYIDDYPNDVFVIAHLLNLFENLSLKEKINLCRYLKLSNKEIIFVTFLHNSLNILNDLDNVDDYSLALFFSDSNSEIVLQIFEVHINKENRKKTMLFLDKKNEELKEYIQRIIDKDPIVKAKHLKLLGIKDSPIMGKLLKLAEKISVNYKLQDVELILEKLKKNKLFSSFLNKKI